MKALILTMSCGECHNTVAKNIQNFLHNKNVESKIVNIYESNQKLLDFNNKGYLTACKYFPHIYTYFWNKERNRNPNKRFTGLGYKSIKKILDYNIQVILNYSPDVIICTHNYASNIVSILKHQNKIKDIPTYAFLLDYVVHPYWEDSIYITAVFTPNKLTNEQLIKKGFNKNQIVETGFPTNPEFNSKISKFSARKMLNLNTKNFTVCVLAGGAGIGNNLKLVKQILKSNFKQDIQILVVCGKNEKMKNKIDKYITKFNLNNITNMGFVNNIKQIMCASDVVFSRGGCGTLSEALNLGIVPIISEKTQANETYNKQVLMQNNIAFSLKKITDAKLILNKIKQNSSILKEKQKNIAKFNVPNGLENAINYILKKYNKKA